MGCTVTVFDMRGATGAGFYTDTLPPPTVPLATAGLITDDTLRPDGESWATRIDDLLRVRVLEDDWDGQGSPAPDPALVDGSIRLAVLLRDAGCTPPDFAIAGSGGTVLFEWHTPLGYLEIEVESPTVAESRFVATETETTQTFAFAIR
jgi:hypothetical protein